MDKKFREKKPIEFDPPMEYLKKRLNLFEQLLEKNKLTTMTDHFKTRISEYEGAIALLEEGKIDPCEKYGHDLFENNHDYMQVCRTCGKEFG